MPTDQMGPALLLASKCVTRSKWKSFRPQSSHLFSGGEGIMRPDSEAVHEQMYFIGLSKYLTHSRAHKHLLINRHTITVSVFLPKLVPCPWPYGRTVMQV